MSSSTKDELRVRVTIDREMPELYARLAGSKRQAREVVHLLRMGIQWEMALRGHAPLVPPVATAAVAMQPEQNASAGPGAQPGAGRKEVMDGKDLAEMTGLTSDYFSGAPMAYQE